MIRDTSAQDQVLTPQRGGRRRLALWAGAAAAVGLAAWGVPKLAASLSIGQSISASRLNVAAAEVGPLVRDVAGEGKVVAAVSPTLYAGNAGTVTLAVQAGDQVKKGQVLLKLVSPELVARLAQERSNADALKSEALRAEADIRQQRAQAQSNLDTALINHTTAKNDLARQQQAFAAGATAAMQVEQARDGVARAEVALKQARDLLNLKDDASKFELAAKRQAFERQQLQVRDLERQLDELNLRSPVDGQVGQLFVTDRMSVAKDAKLLSVVDLSALEVQMQVAESFARELQPGMPGKISGNGQQWKGVVSSISPEVVNNEVAARLRFEGKLPEQLRQNQRLSVSVLLDQRDRVLTLPRGSFIEEGGGRWAYVLQDGVASKRAIRLGVQSLSKVEVLEGLKAGERVVISGADSFHGAERVAISN
ncbi:efflux RND transporter periplasmic adaptor subunit [Paucibacter sp. APW11]|uniref:Efflux RND transporter periplasmic adaptor subunit n=1 Tax=Roseateles aquae TaxID=3077235 RepID=A0ABU3PH07_9BURK|nr:efflux RND transporter periplasmic adaptor subunit [Paucibacter sp. APW11]MDT9001818.1 efflux RND transporter periplasmic adaptor subunit [Paucibacter sp. APW11]